LCLSAVEEDNFLVSPLVGSYFSVAISVSYFEQA
jgi:hypothetical protein